MSETQKRVFIDSFFDFDDACLYLEKHLMEHAEGWEIEEAGVGFVNHQWRVGAIFVRKFDPELHELETKIRSSLEDVSE